MAGGLALVCAFPVDPGLTVGEVGGLTALPVARVFAGGAGFFNDAGLAGLAFLPCLFFLFLQADKTGLVAASFLAISSFNSSRSSWNWVPDIGLLCSTTVASTPSPETITPEAPSRNRPPMTTWNVVPCLPPAGTT